MIDRVRVGKNIAASVARLGAAEPEDEYIQALSCSSGLPINRWGLVSVYLNTTWTNGSGTDCFSFTGSVSTTPGALFNPVGFTQIANCGACPGPAFLGGGDPEPELS